MRMVGVDAWRQVKNIENQNIHHPLPLGRDDELPNQAHSPSTSS